METVDIWVWKDGDSTEFSVKSFYGFFKGEGSEEDLKRYKFFWKIKALPSAQSQHGEWLKTRLLVGLIWREEESGSRVICVACVGGQMRQQIICSANA